MTWTTLAPLPLAREHLAGAADGSGRIYAMGGLPPSVVDGTDRVDRFDPTTGVWSTISPLPRARYGLAGATDSSGRVYVLGGYGTTNPDQPSPRVDRFDPTTGAWSTLASLPLARYHLAAASDGSGRIYAMGGVVANGSYTDRVDRFDPTTGVWSTLPVLPGGARSSLAAASDGSGRVYAIGGTGAGGTGLGQALDRVERFDPTTGVWSTISPLPLARSSLAAASDGSGRVYAIGGAPPSGTPQANIFDQVDRFNPTTGAWSTLSPLPLGRYRHAAASDGSGRIYAISGIPPSGGAATDQVDRFDPAIVGGWQVGSVAF